MTILAWSRFLSPSPGGSFPLKRRMAASRVFLPVIGFPTAKKGVNAQELGELRWYFLPDGSTGVLTTLDQVNTFIACDKDTPRAPGRPLKYRRERLKAIEAHIRSRELKARKSITMAQVAGEQGDENRLKLVAWMDVAAPETC